MNNGTNVIPAEVNNFYNRTLIMAGRPFLVHTRWAQIRDIPANAGTTIAKFRKYGLLGKVTTPLQEGVTPSGNTLSVTDVTVEVFQYGDYIKVTDKVDFTSQDAVLTETADLLGEQMGESIDAIVRDIINAGTNVRYPGSITAREDVNDVLKPVMVDKAVRTLKNLKARKVTKMVDATNGVGTLPINAAFIGIVHPNTSYSMQNDPTTWPSFLPVEKYANKSDVMPGEIGSYGQVRFVESTEAKVFTGAATNNSNADVYTTLIMGQDAYGITRIAGHAVENIVKPFGAGDDPLNQRATSGWKITLGALILNNDNMVRCEHTVAA